MKKVLLINGSPNAQGCTYTALSEVAKSLDQNEVPWELFSIGKNAVRGCIGCGKCAAAGACVFQDDICNELAGKMAEAGAIVVGSPVYYAGPNGALCALLDRAFYSSGKKFANKPAASVLSCRRGGASAAFDRLNKYFTINNMPVVPSQYWNAVHGNAPEEVKQDLEGLQIMRTLGNNLAWILQSLEKADLAVPVRETPARTNFIR